MSTDPTVTLDVQYGSAASIPLLLDVYSAEGTRSTNSERAAIILIHGGGWFRGDKAKERPLATMLVEAGFVVFAPNYRETPDFVFPASRDDILTAAQWAIASEYMFDRTKLAFFGGSAGGNLSVEAGIATGRPSVSWSGIFDLLAIVESTDATVTAEPTTRDLDALKSADINQTGRDDAFLRWTILQEVGVDRGLLAGASTNRHVSGDMGPVFIANSLSEFVPVTDAVAMQSALTVAGIASTLQLIPGTRHGEGYTSVAIGPTLAFLDSVLQADPT